MVFRCEGANWKAICYEIRQAILARAVPAAAGPKGECENPVD